VTILAGMSETDPDIDAKLITAALQSAAAIGWHRVSIAAAAAEAGIPLSVARARFPSKRDILMRFGTLADQQALADVPTESGVRDALFDMLMRRFDAFQAHREGIQAALRALPFDPLLALSLACATKRSMRWMLEAAGVSCAGPVGELRIKGLVAVWLWALRAWDRDVSEDLSGTMAALDTALQRAEQFARMAGGPDSQPAEEATDAPFHQAGTPDVGTPDAGTPDAGTPDADTPDAGNEITPDSQTDPDAPPAL